MRCVRTRDFMVYHSTEIAKARPWYVGLPEYTGQINSSSPLVRLGDKLNIFLDSI